MFKNSSVTIVVDDLKKAEQFYVEILGLKVQFQVEGHLVQVEAPGFVVDAHMALRDRVAGTAEI